MHEWNEREIRDELYQKIVSVNGVRGQLTKLCEELAELIQVTCKLNSETNIKNDVLTFHKFLANV